MPFELKITIFFILIWFNSHISFYFIFFSFEGERFYRIIMRFYFIISSLRYSTGKFFKIFFLLFSTTDLMFPCFKTESNKKKNPFVCNFLQMGKSAVFLSFEVYFFPFFVFFSFHFFLGLVVLVSLAECKWMSSGTHTAHST